MAEHDSTSTVTIQLPPLPSELRTAFVRFYEDALNGREPNASALDVVALPYFDEKGGDPGSVDSSSTRSLRCGTIGSHAENGALLQRSGPGH